MTKFRKEPIATMDANHSRARPALWSALCLLALVLAAVCNSAPLWAAEATPIGRWVTEGQRSVIEVFACGSELCGKVVWQGPNEKQKFDTHASNPAARNKPVCGLTIMRGFKPAGPGKWKNGSIYNPEDGNTYGAELTIQAPQTLLMRGFLGISLFGSTQTWKRDPGTFGTCPTANAS